MFGVEQRHSRSTNQLFGTCVSVPKSTAFTVLTTTIFVKGVGASLASSLKGNT
jgi:hypothetical protein